MLGLVYKHNRNYKVNFQVLNFFTLGMQGKQIFVRRICVLVYRSMIWYWSCMVFAFSLSTDSSDFECVAFTVEFALHSDSPCHYNLVSYFGGIEDCLVWTSANEVTRFCKSEILRETCSSRNLKYLNFVVICLLNSLKVCGK